MSSNLTLVSGMSAALVRRWEVSSAVRAGVRPIVDVSVQVIFHLGCGHSLDSARLADKAPGRDALCVELHPCVVKAHVILHPAHRGLSSVAMSTLDQLVSFFKDKPALTLRWSNVQTIYQFPLHSFLTGTPAGSVVIRIFIFIITSIFKTRASFSL